METADKIKKAVGAYSVYLAAMNDNILTGRFTQNGKGLMDRGNKATKHSIADVLVYMAAAYGKTLTFEEVEMGLIVAANNGSEDTESATTKKSGPDLDNLGSEYSELLDTLLDEGSIGMEISNLIDRFMLHKNATVGYRTLEQAVGVALRNLGWERRRQMTNGVRAYRWYPPKDWSFNTTAEPPVESQAEEESNDFDDVFDDMEQFTSEEPEVVKSPRKKRKGSGVKPDEELSARIVNDVDLHNGITSFELAIKCYDFIANDIEIPETEQDMSHKVKLSIGATMKALGWKKKTKRIDGIPVSGWYQDVPVEIVENDKVETVIRRKVNHAEEVVEDSEDEPSIADGLPRLKQPEPDIDDDIPWSYADEGDAGDEGDEETQDVVYVKLINDDGTETVAERTILMKNAGVYLVPTDGEPGHSMLQWDAEEEIWFCNVSLNEE
tara:strand:+ start:673 stop:1989 length:1317 start_codon:yes stop_codon:yes gene_type:complete